MTDAGLMASWELLTGAVARTQDRVLARIDAHGLPAQWFPALHLLVQSPDHRMPMSQLARELSMTSGGITKLADRMGQGGLIDRRNSSGDRRVVYAALTEPGLRLALRMERQYKAALREYVLDVLTASRLETIVVSARKLDQTTSRVAEDASHPHVASRRDPALPERRVRIR